MKRAYGAAAAAVVLLASGVFGIKAAAVSAAANDTAGAALTKVQADPQSGIAEYKLNSNGMQVLLAERHHTPIVTVLVVYHVGSRNEAVGYTGSTHFLEHMMFRGTAEHDPLKGTGIDDVLKPLGGINNATTYYDRTSYYEIVPSQFMGTCLELEADRMRGALLRESDQKSEMTVVRNELERDEDDPARLMDVNTFAAAYMSHPYHHPVIGWRSDVENVPNARLKQFYNEFYYPNNATLVVIGDFQTPQALELIAKNFGKVPASPQPFPQVYTTEPAQQGERRFVVRRGEDLPKVMIGFHIPKATSQDTYALEVAASILGDEKKQSSRLYKALVDSGMASDCYAYNFSLRDPGMFTLLATATPGTASEKIEGSIDAQLQRLAKEPVSDAELDKAKKSVWKRMKLESADPTGLAAQLTEAIAVADWRWWLNLEPNIKKVTKADVQRVAAKYLVKRNETVGYYYPLNKPGAAQKQQAFAQPDDAKPLPTMALLDVPAQTVAATAPAADNAVAAAEATTDTGTTPHATIASQVRKKVLPNGLTILSMPVHGSGVVSIAGKMRAGDYFQPNGVDSLSDLVADMLDKGSKHLTKDELARKLELMGTSLEFDSNTFFMNFESDVVREDVPAYLSLLSDTLQNPLFLPQELAKSKKQTIAELNAAMADTGQVASNAFYSTVYKPSCVYHRKPFPQQIKEVGGISVEQLKAFHKAHITPSNTVIAIVGDIEPDAAFDLASKNFGSWKGGKAETINVSGCTNVDVVGKRIYTPLSDKTNVEVVMGEPAAIDIKSPDFYAATIANAALGHDTISSRLAELRNKHGLTYGISSFFSENAFPNGAWMIDFSVNPDNLKKSLPIVNDILSDLRKNGLKQTEVSEEAKRLAGEYVVERMRGPHQLADAITKYEILGLGAGFMDQYPERVKAVTVEQANQAIDKYFDPAKLVTSIAGTLPKGGK